MTTNAMEYVQAIQEKLRQKDQGQEEFLQIIDELMFTVMSFLETHPEYIEKSILELLAEPERIIQSRVPWQDDKGNWRANRGYRTQYNSAVGPYEDGLRFHPSVNLSILKFLTFEQILKNSLTGLPIGGGEGRSDFDPRGKSDNEIMCFCQSFMLELSEHIEPSIGVSVGGIGVGAREIGYSFGEYKRLKKYDTGVLTGKPLDFRGGKIRTEATGCGLIYYVKHLLNGEKDSLDQKTVFVPGSGNVAIYVIEKVQELGGKVVTRSDSSGYIYDPEGIDVSLLRETREIKRQRLTEYADQRPSAAYHAGESVWTLKEKADIALPYATQNEVDESLVETLVENGIKIVAEGANMPCIIKAVFVLHEADVWYCPGKVASAGGVAVSALGISQNTQRLTWEREQVDEQLDQITERIYHTCRQTAAEYGDEKNLLLGVNAIGSEKVAKAMAAEGLV